MATELDEHVDNMMAIASRHFDMVTVVEVLAQEVPEGVTHDQVVSALRALKPVAKAAV